MTHTNQIAEARVEELKLACPFCSVPDVMVRSAHDIFSRWMVRCRYCGAFITGITKNGTIKKWKTMLKRGGKL
jgi:uncharacterized Zn finger protein